MSSNTLTKYQQREIVIRQVLEQSEKGKLSPFVDNILSGALDLDQMDARGFTAIHLASFIDDKENILRLLDKAACPVDLRCESGQTPLIAAASKGFVGLIRLFLDRGADLEAKDQFGLTPLMTAASYGHIPAFFVLARRGAVLDVVDKKGCTVVHWAAYRNQVHMLRALRTLGVNFATIDFEGMNALHRAALGNSIHCVEYLVHVGMDLLEKDSKGRDVVKVAKDNKSEAALMTIDRVAKDSREVFQFFTYLYILFWLSIYTIYHQYIFESTIENFLISVLFNFAYLWLFPLFILCKCYNCAHIQPATDSQISDLICEKFEKSLFDELPSITDFCISCSIKRPMRSKHCRYLDKCVLEYDHFSIFLNKTVGKGNRKTYYLWVFMNTFALACFIYLNWCLLHDLVPRSGFLTSYFAYLVIEIYGMNAAYKVVLVCALLVFWFLVWYSALLLFCVLQGLLLNEVLNRHRYKYLFESFEDEDKKRMRFRNPFSKGVVKNFLEFLIN